MNFKTTAFLLLLVVLVGTWFCLVTLQSPTREEQLEEPVGRREDGKAVFRADEFSTESIRKIEIRKNDENPVRISKEGSDWWQTQPVRFPLNSWSTNKIVDESAGLKYTQKAVPGTSDFPTLKEISLDPPLAIITLEGAGENKAKHIIQVGRKLGGHGYVRVNDDPHVYVIKGQLHKLVLEDGINEWRKKSLSGPDEPKSDQVILTRDNKATKLLKVDGNWAFGGDQSGRVSRDAVSTLLQAVDGIYISDFVTDEPESLALYGLDEPATVVKIRVPAPKPVQTQPSDESETDGENGDAQEPEPEPTFNTLTIGAPEDLKKDRYFGTFTSSQSEGLVVFTISKSDVEKFDKSVDNLRDKRITPLKASDVKTFTIAMSGQEPIRLERGTERWAFADPGPGYEADEEQVTQTLEAIVNAEADAFTAHAKPAGQPIATISITATGRPEPDVLRAFPISDQDDHRLVLRNNETTGYHVPLNKIDKAFDPVLALRDRTVLDTAVQDVTMVTVNHPDGTVYAFEHVLPETPAENTESQTQDDLSDAVETQPTTTQPATIQPVETVGTWRLVGHEKFEQDALDDLIEKLLPLKAQRWLESTEAVSGYSVTIATAADTEHTIVIAPETRVTLAADVTETRFETPENLLAALDIEFRYRTILPMSTSDIASISVTNDGNILTIEKNDDGDYVGTEGEKIDESAAGGLFDTVAGLRVKRYVSELDTGQGTCTIEVRTKDNNVHHLVLTPSGATLDDQAFTLEDDARQKLEADFIEKVADESTD